jgi:hypothetical protein
MKELFFWDHQDTMREQESKYRDIYDILIILQDGRYGIQIERIERSVLDKIPLNLGWWANVRQEYYNKLNE